MEKIFITKINTKKAKQNLLWIQDDIKLGAQIIDKKKLDLKFKKNK